MFNYQDFLFTTHKTDSTLANKNQQGQAVVEYVLILVVALALGYIALNLNKGLKTWGESIVGPKGYMICLLETGKLPGQTAGIQDCAIQDVDATFSSSSSGLSSTSGGSGASTSGDPGASSGTSNSGGNDSGSNSSGTSSSSSSSSSASDGGEGTSGDVYTADDPSLSEENAGSTSSGRNSRRKKGKTSSSSNGSSNPDGNIIAINSEDGHPFGGDLGAGSQTADKKGKAGKRTKKRKISFSSGGSVYNGEPGYAGQRHRAIFSGGWMEQDEQKKRSRPIPVSSRNIASQKNKITGSEKRSRLIINKKSKTKNKDIKVGKWSFGNIFRVILIICVIVAMVLLIGSQTYSVKKSMK